MTSSFRNESCLSSFLLFFLSLSFSPQPLSPFPCHAHKPPTAKDEPLYSASQKWEARNRCSTVLVRWEPRLSLHSSTNPLGQSWEPPKWIHPAMCVLLSSLHCLLTILICVLPSLPLEVQLLCPIHTLPSEFFKNVKYKICFTVFLQFLMEEKAKQDISSFYEI